MSDALEAAGLTLLTIAAGMVAIPLGLAVGGLSLLVAGFALDRKDAE